AVGEEGDGGKERSAAERLWRFSLALYARPGVEAACLDLQDRRGLDVNMLLWCCWRAVEGHALAGAEIAAAEGGIAGWQVSVIGPLRALRRRLKGGAGGPSATFVAELRRDVKAAELEAERIAQTALAAAPAGRPAAAPPGALARRNLEAYARLHGAAEEAADRTSLAALVEACAAATR
ncbi:MAG: TIGR02444 family protein, partial [Rhodospirillaceae bacterium]|nr:TIGR02444 family protein [Rhodospirillaceae bacterium]